MSRWFFPSNQGGIGMYNGFLAKSLNNYFDISLVSLGDELNINYYKSLNITYFTLRVNIEKYIIILAKINFLKNGLRSLNDWLISLIFGNFLVKNPPDIIEFMDIHSEAYVFLKRNPKNKRRTKVVIRSHTPWALLRETYLPDEIKGVDGWWAVEREQFCFDECDAITTPSVDLKQQLIRIYNLPDKKITVIPNLLDTEHFKPISCNKDSTNFTFLHVGRFERAKGVITLIKAYIKLAKEIPNVKLINIGQPRGKAYDICLKLIKDKNLLDKVEFIGYIDYKDLPSWYAKSDVVLVTPEIYESFSYTAAQAMACGKLVILSDSGGMPETAGFGHYGKLFKRGDVDDLYRVMKESIFNKILDELPLLHYINENFGLKKLGERYRQFYKSLIE